MKAKLIIDMPNACKECPVCVLDHWEWYHKCLITEIDVSGLGERPEWCPLEPIEALPDMRNATPDKSGKWACPCGYIVAENRVNLPFYCPYCGQRLKGSESE